MLRRQFIKRSNLINLLERLLCLRFDHFLGQLLVIKLDDFFDRAGSIAQIHSNLQQFFQNKRRACNGFQNEQMSALEALRNYHFTFTRQQWNRTHFAKVQANRITRLIECSRLQIEFVILGCTFSSALRRAYH